MYFKNLIIKRWKNIYLTSTHTHTQLHTYLLASKHTHSHTPANILCAHTLHISMIILRKKCLSYIKQKKEAT